LGTAGQTPVLRHSYRPEKIFVISGISVSPKRQHLSLFYQLYFHNIGQEEVCVFLRDLLLHLRGPVIAVLDNSRTHYGELITGLQRQHPRLQIQHFPSDAPELNPDEGVGCLAKRELSNGCPHDVDELMSDLIGSIDRIRKSPRKTSRLHRTVRASPLFCADHCIIFEAVYIVAMYKCQSRCPGHSKLLAAICYFHRIRAPRIYRGYFQASCH
jgi:hypothetical protein